MVKTSVQRKAIAPVPQDEIERSLAILSAKQQFISSATSMGWQMAGMVLIPVIIGVQLDKKFGTSPSYTLGALVLAVGGAVYIVSNTISKVNKEQADKEATNNSVKKGTTK